MSLEHFFLVFILYVRQYLLKPVEISISLFPFTFQFTFNTGAFPQPFQRSEVVHEKRN